MREQIKETAEVRKKDNIESTLSRELLEFVHSADFSKDIILDTIKPTTVKLKDTEISHMPINLLHKGNQTHKAYKALTNELIRKVIL